MRALGAQIPVQHHAALLRKHLAAPLDSTAPHGESKNNFLHFFQFIFFFFFDIFCLKYFFNSKKWFFFKLELDFFFKLTGQFSYMYTGRD